MGSGDKMLSMIRNLGITEIDYLLISNSNPTRTSGSSIITRIRPKKLVSSGISLLNDFNYDNIENYQYEKFDVNLDKQIYLDDNTIVNVFVPYDDSKGIDFSDMKTNSISFLFNYKKYEFLFLGDCDVTCQERQNYFSGVKTKVLNIDASFCDNLNMLMLERTNPFLVVYEGNICGDALDRMSFKKMNNLKINDVVIMTTDGENYVVEYR